MAPLRTISVYLLKREVENGRDALKEDIDGLREHQIGRDGAIGTLHVHERDGLRPDWVVFLGPEGQPPFDYRVRSLSAVLLLRARRRWFAITFGSGRFLLKPESYERDFGLRAALNSVDPERLRAIQARTFHDYVLHTQRHLSRLSTIDTLEVDEQRDLVTGMTGRLVREELGQRVDGTDAARLTANLNPRELQRKCGQLLENSEDAEYRKHWPWIDNIQRVRDPDKLRKLNIVAFTALGKRQFSKFDLFPPELVSGEVVRFRLGRRGEEVVEPEGALLKQLVGDRPYSAAQAETIVTRARLYGLDGTGTVVDEWRVRDCLYFEHRPGGGKPVSVLDRGGWYEIEKDFAGEVERFTKELRSSELHLPPSHHGQAEGDYNSSTAATDPHLALVDKNLIRLADRSGIEPCDLFSDDGHFVHVKRRKGGSGPLSHLFGQAVVSAECFLTEPEFRSKLQEILGRSGSAFAHLVPDEGLDVHDYKIVLALIANPVRPSGATPNLTGESAAADGCPATALPFFAKVHLRLVVRRLRAMGFDVFMDGIRTGPKPPAPSKRRPPRAAPRKAPGGLAKPKPAGGAAKLPAARRTRAGSGSRNSERRGSRPAGAVPRGGQPER